MPSVLDATLVIQMVHFLCAYWILSTFFLKPAYALIMKIDAERAALKNAALKQQEELATQRLEKAAELTEFQHKLQSKPLISGVRPHQLASHELIEKRSTEDVSLPAGALRAGWVKQIAAQLKKRIIHE